MKENLHLAGRSVPSHESNSEFVDVMSAADWIERAQSVLPGGVLGMGALTAGSSLVPLSASGTRITSADGNVYLDYTMGSGVLIHGYQPPYLASAVHRQVDRLTHVYGHLNVPAIRLAEMIVDAVPSAEMLRFAASGAEATQYAMRLARAHTGRPLILKFEGAYHGSHDYATQSLSSGNPAGFPDPWPNSAGIPQPVTSQVLVAPFNDLERTSVIVDQHAEKLAGIIVEPVQRAIPPKPGFLRGLRALADRAGACLIFDEVVTMFRLAWGGAQEVYGVRPDLTCVGKIIGGGLPMSAVCGPESILARCGPRFGTGYVFQNGTTNGNPVAAVAGIATLDHLRKNPPYHQLHELTDKLRSGLHGVFAERSIPVQVIGTGSLWQLVVTDQPIQQAKDIWNADRRFVVAFQEALLDRLVFTLPENRAFTSTAHTDEDTAVTLEAASDALGALATRNPASDPGKRR